MRFESCVVAGDTPVAVEDVHQALGPMVKAPAGSDMANPTFLSVGWLLFIFGLHKTDEPCSGQG